MKMQSDGKDGLRKQREELAAAFEEAVEAEQQLQQALARQRIAAQSINSIALAKLLSKYQYDWVKPKGHANKNNPYANVEALKAVRVAVVKELKLVIYRCQCDHGKLR